MLYVCFVGFRASEGYASKSYICRPLPGDFGFEMIVLIQISFISHIRQSCKNMYISEAQENSMLKKSNHYYCQVKQFTSYFSCYYPKLESIQVLITYHY